MENTIRDIKEVLKKMKDRYGLTEKSHDFYLHKNASIDEKMYAIAQLRDVMRNINDNDSGFDVRLNISYKIHCLESEIL